MQDNPPVGALDLDLLGSQTLGDRELEAELFSLFESQAERLLGIIEHGGDRSARADAAHSLKGGAAAIGAVDVMRRAGQLELMLRNDDTDTGGAIAALGQAVAEAGDAIRDLRQAS